MARRTHPEDHDEYIGILPCDGREEGHYPNVDISIWLRTCLEENYTQVKGKREGTIPDWINGSLVQNGPGKFTFGSDVFRHLFDGSALVRKFSISKGEVTYQCQFVKTESFKQNSLADKIVVPEFGTPVRENWWKRLWKSKATVLSDNTMITVYPFNGSLYTFYESPYLHRLDSDLSTVRCEDLTKLNLLSHASHPHYDQEGNMITLGLSLGLLGPKYQLTKFLRTPGAPALSSHCRSLASRRCSRMFHPSYMHSFSVTKNYYVLIEQPLTVSVGRVIKAILKGKSLSTALRWNGDREVVFHLINRHTKKEHTIKYFTKAFFFLHTINAYEERGEVVVDICSYDSPAMMDCMFIEKLQTAQSNPDYAPLFRGRPRRFVLPLQPAMVLQQPRRMEIQPALIADIGCETPAIHYELFNGRKYRYFYAISSDVDADNAGKLIKVDTLTGEFTSWQEENVYCSEPVFLPRPEASQEDDGILVFSVIWGKPHITWTGIVLVDALDLSTVARVHFQLSGPVPKPLHGCFISSWDFIES